MSQTNYYARVIYSPNKFIYVIFEDNKAAACTAANLRALFEDPFAYHDTLVDFDDVLSTINPDGRAMDDIPGLTLAYILRDKTVVCIFNCLFRILFTYFDQRRFDDEIYLNFGNEIPKSLDKKEYILRMYSEATSLLNSNLNSWRNLDIAPETETQLMKEILSSFDCKATDVCDNNIEVASPVHSAPNTSAPGENIVIPSNFVPVKEYAALHNITVTCAHTWVKNKKMEGHYAKKANQRLYIDKDFIPLDKRTLRKDRTKENPSCKFIPSEDNFIAVQKKMENANFVSSVIRKHIRVYKEHEYYRKHFYHEVVFDRHALIVDVNPEYFIEVLGKTNRELMQAGNAPVVVAEMDDGNWTAKNLPRYNLHHIGQEKGSPFAIIPESDHNSKKYYSIFHPGPVSENLHSPVFEQQRSKFWKDYIRYYDEYGGYNKIPFLNHKTSKKKK